MRCARLPAAASTSGSWKPGVVACTATSHGRRRGELAPGQDYGYVDNGAINLSLVHVSNSLLSVGLVVVENIGSASVGAVWRNEVLAWEGTMFWDLGAVVFDALGSPTCSIDRQIKVFDRTKLAEDLLKMSLVDVLGQALDDNLVQDVRLVLNFLEQTVQLSHTLVLLTTGLWLRPRLRLRLSLRYLPLRRGAGDWERDGERES